MYCGNCGKEISDANKFCPSCGFRLNANAPEEAKKQYVTVAPSTKTPPTLQNAPVEVQNNTPMSEIVPGAPMQSSGISPTMVQQQVPAPVIETVPEKKKKSSKKPLIFIIIGIIVAALAVVGIIFFMNPKEEKDATIVRKFNAEYSDNEGTNFSDQYEIVEQDKYRIHKWTGYDSETDEKTFEIIYEYDDKNKREIRYYYAEDDALYLKEIYELDDDGKYKTCKIYDVEDGNETFSYEFYFVGLDMVGEFEVPDDYAFVEYDEYNRIIVWEDHYSDGSWYRTTSEYNEHGLISEKSVDYEGYESYYKLTPIS